MTNEVVQALMVMSEVYGRAMTPAAADMIMADLTGYPPQALLNALTRCRKELKYFPTVADIISRIEDGRPGVEEAWAMIPSDERESVVWTTEMRDAFGVARPLMDSDRIAARLAFKESYTKLVADARAFGRPAVWEPSFGFDKRGQERAIAEAISKQRITALDATRLLPCLEHRAPMLQLSGPTEPEPTDAPERVREILRTIMRAPTETKEPEPEPKSPEELKREEALKHLKDLENDELMKGIP